MSSGLVQWTQFLPIQSKQCMLGFFFFSHTTSEDCINVKTTDKICLTYIIIGLFETQLSIPEQNQPQNQNPRSIPEQNQPQNYLVFGPYSTPITSFFDHIDGLYIFLILWVPILSYLVLLEEGTAAEFPSDPHYLLAIFQLAP